MAADEEQALKLDEARRKSIEETIATGASAA
jgi:hypothetical protein